MRRLALTLTVLMLLVACGGDGETSAGEGGGEQEPAQEPQAAISTITDGTFTVGTELPAPPFWIGDDYDSITGGYEVDLARRIGQELGLSQTTFVEMPFGGLVAGQVCPCDLALAQVTITPERAEAVDFTSPYFEANQGILVNEGTQVPDMATAKTLLWGAQINTTGLSYLTETVQPESEPQVYNTVVDAFADLRAGQIDAVMLDTPIVLGKANQPDSGLEVVGQFETGEEYGGVLAKDSENTERISQVIDALREEGFLDDLGERYFNDPASVPVLN